MFLISKNLKYFYFVFLDNYIVYLLQIFTVVHVSKYRKYFTNYLIKIIPLKKVILKNLQWIIFLSSELSFFKFLISINYYSK